jgi:hypothetical protein
VILFLKKLIIAPKHQTIPSKDSTTLAVALQDTYHAMLTITGFSKRRWEKRNATFSKKLLMLIVEIWSLRGDRSPDVAVQSLQVQIAYGKSRD